MKTEEIKSGPVVENRPNTTRLVESFNEMFRVEKMYRSKPENAKSDLYVINSQQIMKDPEWIEANSFIGYHTKYLNAVGPNKFDANNLKKVIDAIVTNGDAHFNMTTFFGLFNSDRDMYPTFTHEGIKLFDQSTSSFTCNSVGCIAGFASAIAVGWDDGIVKDISKSTNPNRAWEHIACNFLNIPLPIGESIFFGEKGCIWSYLKANCLNFSDLEYGDDSQSAMEEGDIYEDDWQDIDIELSSVDYKKAAKMLSMILEGEIEYTEKFTPYLTDKHYDKCSQC